MILRRAQEIIGGDLGLGLNGRRDATIILNVRTQVADYAIDPSRLALLCAWDGRQDVAIDGRRVFVDDDTWLLVPQVSAHVRIRSPRDMHAFTILFRPEGGSHVSTSVPVPRRRELRRGCLQCEWPSLVFRVRR